MPRGNTALIDALCLTIDQTGVRLANLPEYARPDKVLIVIITDGAENASTQYSLTQLSERIAHQSTKYGWRFLYLGANQDAIRAAAAFGLNRGCSYTYAATDGGTEAANTALGNATRSWKLDGNSSAEDLFTEDDRKLQVSVTVKQ